MKVVKEEGKKLLFSYKYKELQLGTLPCVIQLDATGWKLISYRHEFSVTLTIYIIAEEHSYIGKRSRLSLQKLFKQM